MKCFSNHTIINLLKDDKARLEYSSNEYIFIKLEDSNYLLVSHNGLDFTVKHFDQFQEILKCMYYVRLAEEHPELSQGMDLLIILRKTDTSFLEFSSIHQINPGCYEDLINSYSNIEYYQVLKYSY